MRHAVFAIALILPAPGFAEEAPSDGRSLMERGAQLFLEGLREELDPALEGLGDMAREFGPAMEQLMAQMGPAFAGLMERVDDLSNYETPEFLPNGDIIIRRKPDAPDFAPPDIGEDGAVEL